MRQFHLMILEKQEKLSKKKNFIILQIMIVNMNITKKILIIERIGQDLAI